MIEIIKIVRILKRKTAQITIAVLTILFLTGLSVHFYPSCQTPAVYACSSTDYNFHTFFQNEKIDCDTLNYHPVSDAVVKFCNLSAAAIRNGEQYTPPAASEKNSGEIKIIIKTPIFFEPEVKFDESDRQMAADSIENEIRTNFKQYGISVLTRDETNSIFSAAGIFGASNEVKILTPDIMKKIYEKESIHAVIDISFYNLTVARHFQFNIKMTASDRRDLARCDRYEARVRFKATSCGSGDILWIDEVTGYSDNSFYYSIFEKGIMYNLKQICIDESAI